MAGRLVPCRDREGAALRLRVIDDLTRAYNRRYFDEQLGRELAQCARSQRPLSLALFDIDHFKAVNDAHGHAAGDEVLREVASQHGDTSCVAA